MGGDAPYLEPAIHDDMLNPPSIWCQELLLLIPSHMVDTTLLIAWHAWYERNEVTLYKSLLKTRKVYMQLSKLAS
jgi:hypothetical protein